MEISNELKKLVDPNNECCCEDSLSNKCKKWLTKQGYGSSSGIEIITDIKFCTISKDGYDTWKTFNEDTEPEAVLKACQWILDNK